MRSGRHVGLARLSALGTGCGADCKWKELKDGLHFAQVIEMLGQQVGGLGG